VTATSDPATIVGSLAAFSRLPDWLAAGMDPRRVGEGLERQVPELRDGRVRLLACTPDRLRAKGDEWVARYTLSVAEPVGERSEIVLVGNLWPPGREPSGPTDDPVGVAGFGEPGWCCALASPRLDLRLQTSDEALPALPRLADPMEAAQLIGPVLRAAGYPDSEITSCDPAVVRYKPASRCTVVVGLGYADGAGGPVPPDRVVLKTHHGDKGEAAWDAMVALWQHRAPWSHAVRLAEPLGYLADERILVQGPVPGDLLLKDLAREAIADGDGGLLGRLRAELSATAKGIAAVHTSGVTYGPTDTIEDELEKVREVVDRLATSAPELAGAAQPLVGCLAGLARDTDPDPVVPCHHDFRPAQVLLDGEGVSFVDFDGACMAEPALDLGRFRAKLRDTGISAPGPDAPRAVEDTEQRLELLDHLCETFLTDYQQHAAVSRERVLLWETCDLLTSLLHAWTKVLLPRVEARLSLLVHQVETGGPLDRG
jgi:hypothetical protein